MRLYCTAEVKPEEIMTRKDKDKDKDKEGRAVHKGLFQKCKKTKWQKMSLLGERHISQKHVSTWIIEELKYSTKVIILLLKSETDGRWYLGLQGIFP